MDIVAIRREICMSEKWISHFLESLNHLLISPDASSEAISMNMSEISRRLESWELNQLNYERLVDENQISDAVDIAFLYRNAVTQTLVKAQEKLNIKIALSQSFDNSMSSNSRSQAQVKLPKLELPKFSGNPIYWPAFNEKKILSSTVPTCQQ